MNITSPIEDQPSIQIRIKGEGSALPQHQWACIRFLGEDEVIDLLRDRLGKSEDEVKQVLESYDRATTNA